MLDPNGDDVCWVKLVPKAGVPVDCPNVAPCPKLGVVDCPKVLPVAPKPVPEPNPVAGLNALAAPNPVLGAEPKVEAVVPKGVGDCPKVEVPNPVLGGVVENVELGRPPKGLGLLDPKVEPEEAPKPPKAGFVGCAEIP